MPSLTEKLRMLDAAATKPPVAQPKETPQAAPACHHVSARFSAGSFSSFRHMQAPVLQTIFGVPFPTGVKPEDLLFLDTETTGLAGGAGTLAFQVGVGYLAKGQFVVEQFLMRDYPEEEPMLAQVAALMRAFPVWVTFNGRTFDIPLLENRFIMNRVANRPSPTAHADVLHPARRVWKLRLGRCTLQRLEQAVLGVAREDDLPGEQVPRTFFRYLQNHDFGPMEQILAHNRQDVVSLAQLFFYLCMAFDRPENTPAEPEDLLSLAKAAKRQGDEALSKKCYRLAAGTARRSEAFAALAAQEKREGNAQRAAKLYAAMLARGEHPIDACEALAKLCEHQLRNPEQALAYTRQALLLAAEPTLQADDAVQSRRNALQYRYARLRRKIVGDGNT
ncbi:MAG: ribonuclease H-like domain-containing protein [Candidatus Limiplasma sp.]|nr:ribonuclease H-like domain-containing protein [Candidatus Limiplasma sp.]